MVDLGDEPPALTRREARTALTFCQALDRVAHARGRLEDRDEIHFNHTAPADASAETLFAVITDYPGYPRFNPAVVKVTVVAKDEHGAEFVADRKTRIGKQVHVLDRYERDGDLVIERTYGPESTGRSTWTAHPVDAGHSTLTIDASMTMPLLPGLVMKPLLRRLFYGINFTPFIQEAQRRAKETRSSRMA